MAASTALAQPASAKTVNGVPYRVLGKTGVEVSLLGVGGSHIGEDSLTDEQAISLMRTAVDEGINFFDNAWEYKGGRSEERMGKALKSGYREKVFLMTKTLTRDSKYAQQQLEASLRRLDVDAIDLWQVHAIGNFPTDTKAVFERGVLEVAVKAREQGKIKYIGFTGHRDPAIHLAVLNGPFEWDTIQMPMNCFDVHNKSFVKDVAPAARDKGLGIIAMKTLASGAIPRSGSATPEEALRYAMSLPVSVVVSGMDSMEKLRANLAVAKAFKPMSETEVAALLDRTKAKASEKDAEWYKA
ncbi:MAG: hypothetical protein AMXMBFR84_06810 [Candidatus Hydrogenedentota bacterium]